MGMYTWLNLSEFERYSRVDDEDMNEVLQQVRSIDNRWFIASRNFKKYRWFRKPIEQTYYSVYERQGSNDMEVRVQMSATDRITVMNFLYGLNIGLNFKNEH